MACDQQSAGLAHRCTLRSASHTAASAPTGTPREPAAFVFNERLEAAVTRTQYGGKGVFEGSSSAAARASARRFHAGTVDPTGYSPASRCRLAAVSRPLLSPSFSSLAGTFGFTRRTNASPVLFSRPLAHFIDVFISPATATCSPRPGRPSLQKLLRRICPAEIPALRTSGASFRNQDLASFFKRLFLVLRSSPSAAAAEADTRSLCLLRGAADDSSSFSAAGAARAAALRVTDGASAERSSAAAVLHTKRRFSHDASRLRLFLPLLLLLTLCASVCLSCGEAKKVLGLARDNKYQPVAEFCFTIPPGERGRVVAQTVVNLPGHELIILNRTEHGALLAAAAEEAKKKQQEEKEEGKTEGNNSSSRRKRGTQTLAAGAVATAAAAREDPLCEELLRAARVREPLRSNAPLQFQSDLPSLFELDLVVDPKLNGHPVSAWLTRCKSMQPLDAMYSIQFLNPGGFWERHFSCDEQGLLELYLLTLLLCSVGTALWWAPAWRAALSAAPSPLPPLPPRSSSSSAAAAAAAFRSVSLAAGSSSACGLLSLAVLLYTLHLLVYAGNGLGVVVLKFLSQFFDACCRCLLCCLLGVLAAARASPAAAAAASHSSPSPSPAAAAFAGPLRLPLHGSQPSFAPGAAVAYIALQIFNLVAEYSLPASTQISAYPLFRTAWGIPSILGSAVVAVLLLMEAAPHLASAVSAQDGPLLRYRLLLASCTTLYFLVPLLLLLFSPPSQVRDSFVLLASEFTAATILFRVSHRTGPDSRFGLASAEKAGSDAHPYIDL